MDKDCILLKYREQIKNFIVFNDDEWNLFSEALQVKKLKKYGYFVEAGKICKEMGFIMHGAVRYINVIDGKEVTGYFSFEGSFITALKSFLNGEKCLYDIKTLEDTVLVTFSREKMLELFNQPVLSCKMERFCRLISESFNILFEDRLKSFIIKTPEERYRDLLNSGKDIINRIPVQFVAQFIGITAVSLSRIRKRVLDAS